MFINYPQTIFLQIFFIVKQYRPGCQPSLHLSFWAQRRISLAGCRFFAALRM